LPVDNVRLQTTYGELVDQISALGLPLYAYHDVYLRTDKATEKTQPSAFVSKGDHLGSGIDFNVFAGQLFENSNSTPSLFRLKRVPDEAYGDYDFRAGGWSAGGGAFAGFRASSEPKVIPVALKESVQSIHMSGKRPVVLGTFLKEIHVLGKLKSRTNIVHLFGVAFTEVGDEVKPTLVVELALCNLQEFFESHSTITTWGLKSRFSIHISDALGAVHDCGITHADVKGQNVLVFLGDDGQFQAKLSDFGHSRPTDASASEGGSMRYWAPECVKGGMVPGGHNGWWTLYGNAVFRDVYALGLVIWEMATNYQKPLFNDMSAAEVARMKHDNHGAVATYLLGRVLDDTPQYIRDIIRSMLQTDPTQRTPLTVVTKKIRDGMGET